MGYTIFMNIPAAKKSASPREDGSAGGRSCSDEPLSSKRWGEKCRVVRVNTKEASPAALLIKAIHHRKILFSLREEKIRRAQNEKSKEYFSVVRRALASGGETERQNSAFGFSLKKVRI